MFGIDLFDTTLGLSAMIALLAGTISFLSPCVLPIVPPYLAYMAGTSPAAVAAGGDQRVTRIDMRVVSAAIFSSQVCPQSFSCWVSAPRSLAVRC